MQTVIKIVLAATICVLVSVSDGLYAAEKPFTNADVAEMARTGASENVIVAKIMTASRAEFGISQEDLAKLRAAGVGKSAVNAIVKRHISLRIAGGLFANTDIAEMVQAGFEKDIVEALRESYVNNLNTSVDELVKLKNSGVGDAVLDAIIARKTAYIYKHSGGVLANADVVKMVKAGLAESTIVYKIQNTLAETLDASPEGLAVLQGAGVRDSILVAVIERHAARRWGWMPDGVRVFATEHGMMLAILLIIFAPVLLVLIVRNTI